MDVLVRAPSADLSQLFIDLDANVASEFGDLYSQTQSGEVDFSSRRLFTSLSMLDIHPVIALHILEHLPEALRQVMPDGRFDTGDIRLAVSQVISHMSLDDFRHDAEVFEDSDAPKVKTPKRRLQLWEDKKADWAKRYSRRFGDPNQAIHILHRDGEISPLDYKFLKKVIVPHMLDRLLDAEFRNANHLLVTSGMIGEMSEFLLKEFRRLGLYSLRYKTALYLAEDIATQPPHPWLVTETTRPATIQYDLERAAAHLQKLHTSEGELDHDDWHRFTELVHHSCSAILGVYSGFMGHDYLMSLRLLRQWLRIEERNLVLWSFCDLRFIDEDLNAIDSSKEDLERFLGRIDVRINSRNLPSVDAAIEICDRLVAYTHDLHKRRESMIGLRGGLESDNKMRLSDLVAITRENILAAFVHAKPTDVKNVTTKEVIGFTSSLKFENSPFARYPSFCIFAVYDCFDQDRSFEAAVEQTFDLLSGHRFCELGFLVYRGTLTAEQITHLKQENDRAGDQAEVFALPLDRLAANARGVDPVSLFFDLIMECVSAPN